MIKLTEQQARAMENAKSPLHLLNPRTQEVFVLIRQDVYNLTCSIVGGKKGEVWGDDDDDLIQRES